MSKGWRKLWHLVAVLTVAYALALQLAGAGFAAMPPSGPDALTALCARSDVSSSQDPQHKLDQQHCWMAGCGAVALGLPKIPPDVAPRLRALTQLRPPAAEPQFLALLKDHIYSARGPPLGLLIR